jgi:hypothetical protein
MEQGPDVGKARRLSVVALQEDEAVQCAAEEAMTVATADFTTEHT